MGIARHKLLDHYRRQDRAPSRVASEMADAHAGSMDDSDGRAITALASSRATSGSPWFCAMSTACRTQKSPPLSGERRGGRSRLAGAREIQAGIHGGVAVSERDPLELLAQVGRAARPRATFAESLLAQCLGELQAPLRPTSVFGCHEAAHCACSSRSGCARARCCCHGGLPRRSAIRVCCHPAHGAAHRDQRGRRPNPGATRKPGGHRCRRHTWPAPHRVDVPEAHLVR